MDGSRNTLFIVSLLKKALALRLTVSTAHLFGWISSLLYIAFLGKEKKIWEEKRVYIGFRWNIILFVYDLF